MDNTTPQTLVERLRLRAEIRRGISTRKSVQEGKPDRLSELLDEAANEIINLQEQVATFTCDVNYLEGELQDMQMRKLEMVC